MLWVAALILTDVTVQTQQPISWLVVHPRTLWPREADLVGWLADNLDQLAACLGVQRLRYIGREMVIGGRWSHDTWYGREHDFSEMRLDLVVQDEHGRLVVVEAQIDPPDHEHLGKLLTYTQTVRADLAVWLVADIEPAFDLGHLNTLAEQEIVFAGRRRFAVVAASVESDPRPGPLADDEPVRPRLRRVELRDSSLVTTTSLVS